MTDNPLMRDGLGADRDDFYHFLMEAHEGLTPEESRRLNARLVLMLANQVGDIDVLRTVLDAAVEVGK